MREDLCGISVANTPDGFENVLAGLWKCIDSAQRSIVMKSEDEAAERKGKCPSPRPSQ